MSLKQELLISQALVARKSNA